MVPVDATIGITCYNARDTISRAILSALTQVGSTYEIIVVDDASTDDSQEVLAQWQSVVPTLRIVQKVGNEGVGAARNTLLEHARGEHIIFFDDDDVSAPGRVKQQVAAIRSYQWANPEVPGVICNTARWVWKGGGSVDYEPTIGNGEMGWVASRQILDLIFLGRPVLGRLGACPTCSQAAPTSFYKNVGGFDACLRRGEDTEMNIRLAMAGGIFHGIVEPLVRQTMTGGSEKAISIEQESCRYWIHKHRAYLEERGIYGFVTKWFRFKFNVEQGRTWDAACDMLGMSTQSPRRVARRIWDYGVVRGIWRNNASKFRHGGLRHRVSDEQDAEGIGANND